MIDLPRYARAIADGDVEEEEVVLLTERTTPDGVTVAYKGRRLSGEPLLLRASSVRMLELPDPRPEELFFVASIAEYNSSHRTDITFGKYTVILVSKQVDENWMEGTVIGDNAKRLGRPGLFPSSFVVPLDIPVRGSLPPASQLPTTSKRESLNLQNRGTVDDVKFRSTPAVRRSVVSSWMESASDNESTAFISKVQAMYDFPIDSAQTPNKTIGLASVQFDFDAREADELSVRAGDSVSVIEMVNAEWASCYDPGRNKRGIVPASFLHFFLNEEDDDDDDNDDGSASATGSSENEASGGGLRMRDDLPQRSCGSSPAFRIASPPPPPAEPPPPVKSVRNSVTSDSSFADSEAIALQFFRGMSFDASDLDAMFGFSGSAGSREGNRQSKAPARPPPPHLSPTKGHKQSPPPRPTSLPQRSSVLGSPIVSPTTTDGGWTPSDGFSQTTQTRDAVAVPLTPDEMLAKKSRIVEDLIGTELQYMSDIGMWEVEILQSAAISPEQKKILTNGIPQLKALSRSLVEQLVEQQSKPPESQCYGFVFMQLRDEFWRTFGFHFRCVEAMSGIVEGKDPHLQEALAACLGEMRSLGSNVFDVPTAVSRPIQRCLKYPLFIGEFIKNTPISHKDHPKLLEALKQMSQLASKMNESKRRKELAVKYREGGNSNESLSQRLAKINVHSMKKKSTRFKFRISSQIGLVHVQRDTVFDGLVESLDICQRRVCKLLHAAQVYKRLISVQTRKYVDTFTAPAKLALNTDVLNAEIRGYCKRLLQETADTVFYMDSTIGGEAKKFLRLPVTKVIQKRYDKLIDFVSAQKTNKSVDDIRLRQCDYEALNAQLKLTLPKLIDNIKIKTLALIESVITRDAKLFGIVEHLYQAMSQEARNYFNTSFIDFADPSGRRLRSIYSLRKAAFGEASEARRNSGKGGGVVGRAQTAGERDAIIRIIHAQGNDSILMRVKERWPQADSFVQSDDKLPLRVEVGDVVMLVQKGLLDEQWFCDNGVYKGYLPGSHLERFVQQNGNGASKVANIGTGGISPTAPVSVSSGITEKESRPTAIPVSQIFPPKTVDDEPSLIDLEDNLLDLTTPTLPKPATQPVVSQMSPSLPAVLSSTPTPMRFSPLNPFIREPSFTETTSSVPLPSLVTLSGPPPDVSRQDCSLQKSAFNDSLKENESDTSMSRFYEFPPNVSTDEEFFDAREENISVSPLRTAPLPPPRDGELGMTAERPPPSGRQIYKVEFSFEATEESHTSVSEGEQVVVLEKNDDDGNAEWWLVRKKSGAEGFVPASYLSAL